MFSIGPSSYPDLFGIDQLTSTERIALQFLSMKVDFDQMKADEGSGDRLSPNEGHRSKERCYYLWNNRAALGIVVAPPLTSRHYVNANAIDVGVTMANGRNRALTPAEFDWMHTQAERRGFTWTGRNFGEPWHIEGATRPEVVPPYPNARELVAAGPNRPTTKPTTPAPPVAPAPDPYLEIGEDDMQMVTVAGSSKEPLAGDIAVFDGLTAVYHTQGQKDAYQVGRSMGILKPGQNTDQKIRARLTDLGLNIGVDELQARLRAVKQAGGYIDAHYEGKF
ncbi:M15 family metallopeptidase [Curtobacterium citreum]|uniref:M15 family metallopeptidase n=1 Tax=Curtobacterium citreum TaxID=2036 RepID=UPI002549E52D|nr:M15 family metallopeptidase [Curtobacterium citreum]MDK8171765.1 M15 family metallopeptidase [Curtobacterium citreum]